jgi:uncharacterized protein YdeI (YjbR/CyaY-like superfamily)
MTSTNPKAGTLIALAGQWQREFTELRRLALANGLTEELKWGNPCYTHPGSHIVLTHEFKEYTAYLVCKGALLDDPSGILSSSRRTSNPRARCASKNPFRRFCWAGGCMIADNNILHKRKVVSKWN